MELGNTKEKYPHTLEPFKTEHLILLVGANPLPNAVAGKLLVAPGGEITLVHSKGTAEVARKLCRWLSEPGIKVKFREVEESYPYSIVEGLQAVLDTGSAQKVGLHYTGGTKAMSVHTYRALERWAGEKGKEAVFSYLDARSLKMVFDPVEGKERPMPIYVGQALEIKLEDLMKLHGWELQCHPTRVPLLPNTARVLAEVCGEDDGFKEWKKWIDEQLIGKCRREDKENGNKELTQAEYVYRACSTSLKWKSSEKLDQVSLTPYLIEGHLDKVFKSLRTELGISGEVQDDFGLKHNAFGEESEKFRQWLHGTWLEHRVLDALSELAEPLGLHEYAQNIETKEVQFEVDVVALRGYQLFALSCSTDEKKSSLKLKLFEAYVRARQLGGDEARVALVCCSDNPEKIEKEMRRDITGEGSIRVFGRRHLADLNTHIKNWIQSQIT